MGGRLNRENEIVQKSFQFSLAIMRYTELLEQSKRFVLANQMLRSGTAIGANICEAQNAESLPDFIHKMKLAAKESGEAIYWLGLCERSENYPDCKELIKKCQEIQLILSSIVATSKKKLAAKDDTF